MPDRKHKSAMKKLNLSQIARQVDEIHEDVETSFGKVRVYHVPDAIIWSLKPDWEPVPPPPVQMPLATGQKQPRAAKAGDPGFEQYEADRLRYEGETDEIQFAARYVLALRDVEYPADLSHPPENYAAFINGSYPPPSPGDVRRKHFWLKVTLLARRIDAANIQAKMIELNTGVTAEAVDEVKKSLVSITKDAESEAVSPA
jgi:hypothetical protein